MATVHRLFIFATCFLSGIGALFSVVSLATEEWVVTESAKWTDDRITSPNTIKYGLFQGYYSQQEPASLTIQITMTCLIKENVCALLCGRNADERTNLLKQLYDNDPTANQDNNNCPSVQRAFTFASKGVSTFAAEEKEKKFINAGVWISTIVFLVLSIALGALSSALALWNTVSNPVEAYFSIFGLYIYNSLALCSVVIAMVLWGVMHVVIMFHDVGIFNTLTGLITSDKRASPGYSFWINFIPIWFYILSIALLYTRQYLLSRDPSHKIVQREDNADPGIYLY